MLILITYNKACDFAVSSIIMVLYLKELFLLFISQVLRTDTESDLERSRIDEGGDPLVSVSEFQISLSTFVCQRSLKRFYE